MGGIAIAWHCRNVVPWWPWLLAAGIALAISIALVWARRSGQPRGSLRSRPRLWLGVTLVSIALTGAALAQAAWQNTLVDWPAGKRLWRARVDVVNKLTEQGVTVDATVLAAPTDWSGRRVRISLQGKRSRSLSAGDVIACWTQINPGRRVGNPGDFDYGAYLAVHGISGMAYAADSLWALCTTASGHTAGGFTSSLLRLRQKLVNRYASYLDGDQLAIIAALTLGDKSLLDADTRALFSDTGTSHILALSGLHLSILFTLMQFVVLRHIRRRVPRVVAHAAVLIALWLFVWLAGAPLSLQRAAWMLTLLQVGNCLRPSWGSTLNNLCFAALTLLVASPLSLFDVGFQMSFAAVLGIVLLGSYVWGRIPWPYWSDRGASANVPAYQVPSTLRVRFRRWGDGSLKYGYSLLRSVVWPFVSVSLSAQFATAPFILYYFHSLPPYSLLANVIVIPSAYVLLGGALLFFLVPIASIQGLVARVLQAVLGAMTGGLEHISRWPGASLTLYPTTLTIVALVAVPCLIYALCNTRLRRRRVNLIVAMTCITALAAGSEVWRLRPARMTSRIVVYDVSRASAIHFIVSARQSYLYASLSPDSALAALSYVSRNYWAPRHLASPTMITAPQLTQSHLVRRGNLFVFGHKRLYVLRETLAPRDPNEPPVPVDILVVGRGCRSRLAAVLAAVIPRQVVLDGSLTPYYRQRWIDECRVAGIACYDVRERGAYILPL